MALSAGTAELAAAYLAALGIDPGGADLLGLVQFAIYQAMVICAPDFQRELAATVGWVNGRMSRNGVSF